MSILKQLPHQLNDPVAILKNPQANTNKHDSVIVLTEWTDEKGQNILVPKIEAF